jgi:cytochrome c peroxidase
MGSAGRWRAAAVVLLCSCSRVTLLPPVLGLEEFVAAPESNPVTKAAVALGRRLFGDPIVSRDWSTSCASCHRPSGAFADSVALSRGVAGRTGRRNAPTLLNRAYGAAFFWDGRAASLEEAVLLPIADPNELALPLSELTRRIRAVPDYRERFARAYAGESISAVTIGRALASYVRTLRSGNSAVDRYSAGDRNALSREERAGRALFLGRANCATCHAGPNFTDERFHNTGVSGGIDRGRLAVTGDSADLGRFKVPTLRNVSRTAPYMHDGSLRTLEEVVSFYDSGGGKNPRLDAEIRVLRLDAAERRALAAFLRALTGPKT